MQLEGSLWFQKEWRACVVFTVIFIYVSVSVFVYKVFFVHYILCKASSQISKNSTLWIVFPD